MDWKKLDLEVSLKPFRDRSDAGLAATARTLFRQWKPMIDTAETVSLMFWAADGSEILDYDGKLSDTFEWAKWIGVANPRIPHSGLPPEQQGIHERPRLYMDDPPDWSYADFRHLLKILRDEFRTMFGRKLRLGATFDPGPEFARSSFKYERHPEVCRGFCLGGKTFVCCYMKLHADHRSYAACPDGIPEGTSFGSFLGKQSQKYLSDMGFDYLWLSNGFGFGMETWGHTGAVFDGETFSADKCAAVKEAMHDFWRDFRRECPDFPIETRGTNLSTGMDLASDATPLREIYREVRNLEVPPNSPWAALNSDFGLELAGWMSHIAELPAGKGFPFRYYIHDIWFMNSPWLDRYGRSPHDIYLPLSIARLDAQGRVQLPDALHILSVDDSRGRMPDQVPEEVIPHLRDARRTAPDQSGPLVWVYPFDEYHDLVYAGERLEEVYAGDHLICGALNCGLPLNCVISGSNFLSAPPEAFRGRILLAPTVFTVNPAVMDKFEAFLQSGGTILFYGPARGERIEKLLGLVPAEPMRGELIIDGLGAINHLDLTSAGPIDRALAPDSGTTLLASYSGALPAAARRGNALWVRGSNSFAMEKDNSNPQPFDPAHFCRAESLLVRVLAEAGYDITFQRIECSQPFPRLTLRCHDNALYLAGFGTDTTVTQSFRFPDGAPLFTGCDALLRSGKTVYPAARAVNLECRVFVAGDDAILHCREAISLMPGVKRRIHIEGLRNTRVVFRPETGHVDSVRFRHGKYDDTKRTLLEPSAIAAVLEEDAFGPKYILENTAGDLLISWGEEN